LVNIKEGLKFVLPENRELRRIFGLKRDEIIGGWRKFSLQNRIRMVKLREIRYAGHVAHRKGTNGHRVWLES
jgi:hypothetical protein